MARQNEQAALIQMHIAARIRAARFMAKLSMENVAADLDVTFQQIQKYENGKNYVTAAKLLLLARIVGKPIEWFFDGAPGPTATSFHPDPTTKFLALPYAADLTRDYVAIKHNTDRQVVASVASALARNGGA